MRFAFEQMLSGTVAKLAFIGCSIPKEGVFAGRGRIDGVFPYLRGDALDIGCDNYHYPLNYGYLLRKGIPSLMETASENAVGLSGESRERLMAIAQFLQAFKSFIAAHAELARAMRMMAPEDGARLDRIADNCDALTRGAPESFEQALQLFFFAWRIRSVNFTSCIGRMDVQLQEAYNRSRADGMTKDEARELVAELVKRLNELGSGDTLMNVMLGGVDADGKDVSGELGILIMEVCGELGLSEPHINVRIHADTPPDFREAAARLMARGQGQGTLYVDEHIIPILEASGIPREAAREYANDGCTEITLEGNAGIFFWQMESMKALELALHNGEESPNAPNTPVRKWNRNALASRFKTQLKYGIASGDVRECGSFEEFMECFYKQYDAQMKLQCERVAESIKEHKLSNGYQTSLLAQSMLPSVLKSGLEPVRGGYRCDNYQLLSGSLPTVADSLCAVREAVFNRKLCTMAELMDAIDSNFVGYEALQAVLRNMPKFGNDDDTVDLLAAELAAHFCRYVESYPFPCDVHVLPGIYNIDFHIFAAALGATPDGRSAGEAICCHYSPTPCRAVNGITAALHSASKGNLPRGAAASPVYLTLPRLLDTDYVPVFLRLIEGCEALRLPIINLSVVNVEELMDAREHPEKHRDLVVRVWGYNAYFTDLDDQLQIHIINRTLKEA